MFRLGIILAMSCMILACADEDLPPTTWNDIKQLKLRSMVDGVAFEVPLSYSFGEYARNLYNWPKVSKDVREGKTWETVDVVKIYALLPDLEPVNEQNLDAFMALGWGQTLRAFITHPRPFDYFFKNSAHILQRMPDVPEMPGLLHYVSIDNLDEVFLTHEYATPELTRIRCSYTEPRQSPYCEIDKHFRIEITRGDGASVSTMYYLQYSFSRAYLSQWREIDHKLKALFDQFAQSANQNY